jgi:predicted LPLAT superfamily acyltransferase
MAENKSHVEPHTPLHTPNWQTEQERSNAFAMKMLVWVALHLGRNIAQFFLLPITFYFWATSPKVRAASAQYLRKVEASLDLPTGKLSTLKHIHTFSVIVLDRVFMLSGQTNRFNTYIHNFDQMKAVHDRGEGGLFVGAHLGSFEALRVLGTRNPANDQMLPKLVVRMAMYEENARKINRMLEAINPEATQYVISLGQANSMLQLQATIDKGEFVGMLADRHVGAQSDKQLNMISFLGETAAFPDGPFRLAMVLKRPVFLMFGLYRGGNRYEIFFEELLMPESAGPRNRSAQLASWQRAYVERVEHYCRLAPYNWFNFYDFWRK